MLHTVRQEKAHNGLLLTAHSKALSANYSRRLRQASWVVPRHDWLVGSVCLESHVDDVV